MLPRSGSCFLNWAQDTPSDLEAIQNTKCGFRSGDGAHMAYIELVDRAPIEAPTHKQGRFAQENSGDEKRDLSQETIDTDAETVSNGNK